VEAPPAPGAGEIKVKGGACCGVVRGARRLNDSYPVVVPRCAPAAKSRVGSPCLVLAAVWWAIGEAVPCPILPSPVMIRIRGAPCDKTGDEEISSDGVKPDVLSGLGGHSVEQRRRFWAGDDMTVEKLDGAVNSLALLCALVMTSE
jgi:hypothetical protein